MRLIVIDGIDGSGKATQAEILLKKLKEKYENVFLVSFPNYGSDGCIMVEKYLHGEIDEDPNNVNAYAASTFYAIDRYMFFKKNRFPEDAILICNRYVLSNIIHQMSKLHESKWYRYSSWLTDLEYYKYGIPTPTIEIYLYLKPETSYRLIKDRYDGDESKMDIHESMDFLKQSAKPIMSYLANDAFAKLSLGSKLNVVDCNTEDGIRSIESIADEIYKLVEKVL